MATTIDVLILMGSDSDAAVGAIRFDGMQYRRDIGRKAL